MNHFIHPAAPLPEMDAPDAQALGGLLVMGRIHSVFPAVFDAVRTTDAYAALPEEVRTACRREVRRLVVGQTMRTDYFLKLYRRILEGGVTPLVVKGIVLRSLYENPDYRASSDEDLLVQKGEFFRLDAILREAGFCADLGENPLQEHEITYWHPKNGVHLEIHLTLFPEDSGAYGDLNEPFGDVFDRRTAVEIQGTGICTLEPTAHMLYLICHALKHFLHSGFGIRQVCDMVIFAEHFGGQIDWLRIEGWARKQGYYLFWMNLMEIGERYLGFSWEKAGLKKPSNVVLDCAAMLDDLLDSGVYGKSSEDRVHSSNMTLQAAGGQGRGGLLAAMFPDFSYMKGKYPYLEHRKWLLPVAWGQRAAGYLRRSGRQEIRETVNIGKRRVELLKQYGLTGRNTGKRSGK